jgi:hypothetical protein
VGGSSRALILLACACAIAHADPSPEAEKLFRDGRSLLKDGQISAACDAFAASSKLGPSVGTYLNLGDCRTRLHQTASAWAAFVEAGRLAGKLGDARKAEADRRAGELEPLLSYLTIEVAQRPSDLVITRDDVAIDAVVWGQGVAIDAGHHVISARAPGFDPWSSSIEIKPDGDHARVQIPALHAHPVAVVVTPRAPILTPTRDAALVAGGAGVLVGGLAIVLAFQAKDLQDQARAVCPVGEPCHDLAASQKSDRAVSRANLATVTGAIGGAAIVAGVALWFLGRPQPVEAHVVAAVERDAWSLAWAGSF